MSPGTPDASCSGKKKRYNLGASCRDKKISTFKVSATQLAWAGAVGVCGSQQRNSRRVGSRNGWLDGHGMLPDDEEGMKSLVWLDRR
jgi:hypothetical protein